MTEVGHEVDILAQKPLAEGDLALMTPVNREKALEIRTETLRDQLFTQVKGWELDDGGGFILKHILPETLPGDQQWIDYLISRRRYHVEAVKNRTVGDGAKDEMSAMQTELALGTLRGTNTRGDLVIEIARQNLAQEEKALKKHLEFHAMPQVTSLLEARIEYAKRMLAQMEERFGEKKP